MDLAHVGEALKEQRTRIDRAIAALEGVSAGGRTRPHMSAAARKRISEAIEVAVGKEEGKDSQEV